MIGQYIFRILLFFILIGIISGCKESNAFKRSNNNDDLYLNAENITGMVKHFPQGFQEMLTQRGKQKIYTKENSSNFEYIGMPIGGIGAGQLYLGGDGKLWFWDIFNTNYKMGDVKGEEAYEHPYKRSEPGRYGTVNVNQGFTIQVKTASSKTIIKSLDRDGITDISFIGEYPIGHITYRDNELPVSVELEAFSPFIPLDVKNSSYPATNFIFKVKNTSQERMNINFGGWLENAICIKTRSKNKGTLVNQIQKLENGGLQLSETADASASLYDYGSMALTLKNASQQAQGSARIDGAKLPESVFAFGNRKANRLFSSKESTIGSLSENFILEPGEQKELIFVLTWYFPKSQVAPTAGGQGKSYNKRFENAADVAANVIMNFDELTTQTRLWHNTWYDSNLPYWFLDRTFLNTSILASSTSHIFEDGRFYGFEGGYQGMGTCTHVWGYVQAMGRLFPELEISLREKTDFVAFPAGGLFPSGVVNFRGREKMGEGWGNGMAVDGQAGIILRSYLTHQTSPDNSFLKRNYSSIKIAMQGLTKAGDADHDGILTGAQHNTLDADWYGKITWLSLQYEAALRAMAQMAGEMKDYEYATFCVNTADKGKKYIEDNLFNGEYFIQEADPAHPQSPGVYTGCEYSQLFGQSWAYQVGLGTIVNPEKITSSLNSLWKYNFTTDVGTFRKAKPAGRWYAMPGEGGFIACTWPKGGSEVLAKGNPRFAAYNNESQNGYEYALSHLMMSHNMPLRSLAHTWYMHNNRYEGSKRNPWCEVEWGIHYSRSMASYGLFTAACGFEYNGSKGYIAFDPKFNEDDFKAPFVSAEGWGTFTQKRNGALQKNTLTIRHGNLTINQLTLSMNTAGKKEVRANVNGKPISTTLNTEGLKINIYMASLKMREGDLIEIDIQ